MLYCLTDVLPGWRKVSIVCKFTHIVSAPLPNHVYFPLSPLQKFLCQAPNKSTDMEGFMHFQLWCAVLHFTSCHETRLSDSFLSCSCAAMAAVPCLTPLWRRLANLLISVITRFDSILYHWRQQSLDQAGVMCKHSFCTCISIQAPCQMKLLCCVLACCMCCA